MATQLIMSHEEIFRRVGRLNNEIEQALGFPDNSQIKIFPVGRGGVPVAYALRVYNPLYKIVERPNDADVIVDDIIDSGGTMGRLKHHMKPFFSLVNLRGEDMHLKGTWIIFPWEVTNGREQSFEDNVTRLLQFIGENPEREGLRETPHRVAKAWKEWTEGYSKSPAQVLKTFDDGGENYDQILLERNIPFYSHCEHHLAPFFGVAHVGYIPDGKIVGLSKLPELVDLFGKRLQVQERLTNQIADALWDILKPKGVGVVISARHLCMESRGKKKSGASTVSSALRGAMADEPSCRSEFFSLIKL